MRRLAVNMNGTLAGILSEEAAGRSYKFEYDSDYMASCNIPVSVTLPRNKKSYESNRLFPFFANWIPEGANRRLICRARHLDERDLFGILYTMAGCDCVGAVSLRRIEDD